MGQRKHGAECSRHLLIGFRLCAGAMLLAGNVAWAQTKLGDPTPIENLATDSHGSTLYFTTSLRQRGTNQSGTSKVFGLNAAGLQLIQQSSFNSMAPGAPVYTRPSVSEDDTVLAINWYPWYACGSSCSLLEVPSNVIRTPAGQTSHSGVARISRNGRYLLLYDIPIGPPPGLPPPTIQSELLDLISGMTTIMSFQPAGSGQVVANDGTLLVQNGSQIQLVGPGGTVPITPAAYINNVQLAADASRIVYDDGQAIHVLDVGSGGDRQLALGYFPILADDGQRFSYLNPSPGAVLSYNSVNQVWLGDALSGTMTQLTHEPDGIAEQVITGDGLTVFATTNTGRILSIDVPSGNVTQLLDAAPSPLLELEWPAVPGSYNLLSGTSDTSTPVWIDGISVPVLGGMLQPSEIAIQVPWEVQPDPSAAVVVWGKEPAWEQVIAAGVAAMDGITLGGIHQDWSALIDPSDPARPGEIIHMYGIGWGPVDGTVASGQPTPTDRLYRITAPCQWRAINQQFIPSTGPAPVQYPFDAAFSGLAPGFAGVYQFDFVIPPDWSYPLFSPMCIIGSDITQMQAVPVTP